MKLVGAQVFEHRSIRRPPKVLGKIPNRTDMRFLQAFAQPFDTHIFDHPHAQRDFDTSAQGSLVESAAPCVSGGFAKIP